MAVTLFVRGASGLDTATGVDWAHAVKTVAYALTKCTGANDLIVVDAAETYTATAQHRWVPPTGNVSIISATSGAGVTYTPAKGATVSMAAVADRFMIDAVQGTILYISGVIINGSTANSPDADIDLFNLMGFAVGGSGLGGAGLGGGDAISSGAGLPAVAASLTLDGCTLDLKAASATAAITIGATDPGVSFALNIRILNTPLICSGSRTGTFILLGDGVTEIAGSAVSATGATKPAATIGAASISSNATLTLRDTDCLTAPGSLLDNANMVSVTVLAKNCQLNASGTVITGSFPVGTGSMTLRQCLSAAAHYHFFYMNSIGWAWTTANAYLSDGALFRGSPIAWYISTNSRASEYTPFIVPVMEIWNTIIADPAMVEIEFMRVSATPLTDRDIWSDIDYPTTAAIGLYNYSSNRNARPFTGTAVNRPLSTAPWTGALGNTPTRQKLQHTLTAAEVGLLQARVYIGKPSELVYIDPVITPGGTEWVMAADGVNAAVDLDFVNDRYYQTGAGRALSSLLTVTRAGTFYADDSTGRFISFPPNTPRRTDRGLLVEDARINWLRNNSMQGVVTGSPGTAPTNWFLNVTAGLTRTIVASGTINGMDYIDVRVVGTTPSASGNFYWGAELSATLIAANTGEIWTSSWYETLIGGSFANVNRGASRIAEFDVGGSLVVQNDTNVPFPTATMGRQTNTRTLAGVGTKFIRADHFYDWGAGVPIDFTVRIAWPQLEVGDYASSPIRTTTAAIFRPQDVVSLTTLPSFGSEYTFYSSLLPQRPNSSGVQYIAGVSDGTGNNRFGLYRELGLGKAYMNGGGSGILITGSAMPVGVAAQSAVGYRTSNQGLSVNGSAAVTGASANVPVGFTRVDIGAGPTGAQQIGGFVKRAAIWPSNRISNAGLAALTAP